MTLASNALGSSELDTGHVLKCGFSAEEFIFKLLKQSGVKKPVTLNENPLPCGRTWKRTSLKSNPGYSQ